MSQQPSSETVMLPSLSNVSPYLVQRVETVLDKFRVTLHKDGGDIQLLAIDGPIAHLRMQGACIDCPMSFLTLKIGVERILKQEVPEIKGIKAEKVG